MIDQCCTAPYLALSAEKHRLAFQERFPGMARSRFGLAVYLVDGEMFSWYGSRLLSAADYLCQFTATPDT
ncbi:MAG: hypothetical protein KF770_05535 [Anaerolineae bacterium]|nr:hypothetical protein [Anaerolineae bacterium]